MLKFLVLDENDMKRTERGLQCLSTLYMTDTAPVNALFTVIS